MNRTIISIEVQNNHDKEANIIVRGERNNQIMFENGSCLFCIDIHYEGKPKDVGAHSKSKCKECSG